MKRRSRAGGKPIKGRRRKAPEPKRRNAPKAVAHSNSSTAGDVTDRGRLIRELNEAREQQTATSEVLQVISRFPGDVQPVFATLLEKAVRICDATFGNIFRYDGDAFHLVATLNTPPALAEARKGSLLRPSPNGPFDRMLKTKKIVHVADVAAEKAYTEQRHPSIVAAVELGGVRTISFVPLLKGDDLIGVFALHRQEVRPFTDKQIELVKNFAAQAVIAIENARLLSELREALAQQTATSEVLQVISSSPGDLEPVFATMLESAATMCDAKFGNIFRWDGEVLNLVATYNTPPAFSELRRRSPLRPDPENPIGRMISTKAVVHIADLAAERRYVEKSDPYVVAAVELAGIRTVAAVPMLKENELIGAIIVYRQEVRPFTDKQIELVKNFAAQAVIAIENARLLNELRQRTDDLTQRTDDLTEALQQQTATSEVLSVISSSPGELQPVFDTMLAKATHLCEASFGVLVLRDSGTFRNVAMHNPPPVFAELRRLDPVIPAGPLSALGRVAATKQLVHIFDYAEDAAYKQRDPATVSLVERAGARTLVVVPMLKEKELIGAISIFRQDVRPFTDKQIALVENFAAQAVIAIENARLLNELRQRTTDLTERTTDLTEALEQQTATSEVLQVISHSPGDLKPVFEAMLASAMRICEAKFGHLLLYDGESFHAVDLQNLPPAYRKIWEQGPIRPNPKLALG
jgi:two-component system, NtrC family, sensor kinase